MVEAVTTPTNDTRMVINFLKKNTFLHFGAPRTIISDVDKHFYNRLLDLVLAKYGVKH